MHCTAVARSTALDAASPPIPRSSCGVSYSSFLGGVVVLGGEHSPRTPINSDVHLLVTSPEPAACWTVLATSGPAPPPRVAHTQVVDEQRNRLVVFGGRQGVMMDEAPLNDMYVLDLRTLAWEEHKAGGEECPAPRSFHTAAVGPGGDVMYMFGGCGVEGRLNDLWVLQLAKMQWRRLPSAGAEELRGRGGPCLVATQTAVHVLAGFAGEESSDCWSFDLSSEQWAKAMEGCFRPRSVAPHALLQVDGAPAAVCMFGGEVCASDRGHEGAGGFANDVLVLPLLEGGSRLGSPLCTECWEGGDAPQSRGWTHMANITCADRGRRSGASVDAAKDRESGDEKTAAQEPLHGKSVHRLVLFGGLSGSDENPERLNDTHLIEVELVREGQGRD